MTRRDQQHRREFNTLAQQARHTVARLGQVRQVQLNDGTTATTGDTIVTRRNHRRLVTPPTSVEVLERVLARDTEQHFATSQHLQQQSPAAPLRRAATRYTEAVTLAREVATWRAATGVDPKRPQAATALGRPWNGQFVASPPGSPSRSSKIT